MPTELLVGLVGALMTISTLVGSWAIQRRYRQLGGGEAQTKLNVVYKELTSAFEDKNAILVATVVEARAEIIALKAGIEVHRTERLEAKQEVLQLHETLRLARVELADLKAEIVKLRLALPGGQP